MALPHLRLLVVLLVLLLETAHARTHVSLRGGRQASLRVKNATAVVNKDSDGSDLADQEVDDSFNADVGDDEDPESVYEATGRETEVNAELANHNDEHSDEPSEEESASVVAHPKASSDIEAAYEDARRVALKERNSTYDPKTKVTEVKALKVTSAGGHRPNRLRQLMHTIARNASKHVNKLVAPPVPGVNMQVKGKRSREETQHPDAKQHATTELATVEAGAMDATTKIIEMGHGAESDMEDESKADTASKETAQKDGSEDVVDGGANSEDASDAKQAEDVDADEMQMSQTRQTLQASDASDVDADEGDSLDGEGEALDGEGEAVDEDADSDDQDEEAETSE